MTPEKAVAILTTLSVMYSDVMVDTTPEELQEALEYGINAIRRENWGKIDNIDASTKIQTNDCMWCDEGFFTRDDERDYIEEPLTEMIENQYGVRASARCYIEDGNYLDVDINLDDGYSFNIKLDKPIDMRRIRLPKDLQKYVSKIFDKFSSEYSSATMYDEIESSTKITASTSIDQFVGQDIWVKVKNNYIEHPDEEKFIRIRSKDASGYTYNCVYISPTSISDNYFEKLIRTRGFGNILVRPIQTYTTAEILEKIDVVNAYLDSLSPLYRQKYGL